VRWLVASGLQAVADESTLVVDLGLIGVFAGITALPLIGLAVVFSFFAEARRVRSAGRFAAIVGVVVMLGAALLLGMAGGLVERETAIVGLEVGAVITVAGFCSIVVARLRGA